jgi:hypothetical protein
MAFACAYQNRQIRKWVKLQINKLKKSPLTAPVIISVIGALSTLIFIYIGFAEPHDGDFCDLVQTRYNSDYDFLVGDGIGRKILLSKFVMHIIAFFTFTILLQTPFWLVYYLIKTIKKKRTNISPQKKSH